MSYAARTRVPISSQDGHRGVAGQTRSDGLRLRHRRRPFAGGVQHVRTAGADHAAAVGRRLRPHAAQRQADGGCKAVRLGAVLPATLAGICC